MVSFFGLKFGSKDKKSQKQSLERQNREWNRVDQNSFGRGQYFGDTNNPPRPETSYSTRTPVSFRTPFSMGANSSMVDLSMPSARRPSMSSLRHWATDSSANLPLPPTLAGPGVRVGLPERPSTAGSSRTKEWVNPLDVHFCKEPIMAKQPESDEPKGGVMRQIEFSVKTTSIDDDKDAADTTTKKSATHKISSGYPSPPASSNGDSTLPLTISEPSSLGILSPSTSFASSLPSPVPSATRSSDDHWDSPVVRNVPARRDTTMFHSARRRSFTKDIQASPDDVAKMRKQQQTEGFAGNFAAFDFGEEVRRQTTIDLPAPQIASTEEVPTPKISEVPFTPTPKERTPSVPKADAATPTQRTSPTQPLPILESVNSFEFPMPAALEHRSPLIPQRPSTSYGPGQRSFSKGSTKAGGGSDPLDLASTLADFRPRADSDVVGLPRPTRPAVTIPTAQDALRSNSPFGGALPEMTYTVSIESAHSPKTTPKSSMDKPRTSPPKKSIFPSSKNSLPRGRQPPRRPPRSDEATAETVPARPEFSVPNWGSLGVDAAEPRRSAMPAPLASSGHTIKPSVSSPSSDAPRLISSTFKSLELSLEEAEDSFASAFELALEKTVSSPSSSDFFSLSSTPTTPTGTVTRVEAKKAPPRPPPITLPPSPTKSTEPSIRSPRSATTAEFQTTFI
ncbi:hypothetical protein VHEMI06172 [[Torrubiella] hemipterigena]|uniref:Uncharacterized protein n=1 Tax=[Torrubiella] hemipterigena TaxID=1531966 RepID=A0A0A1T6D2_9HYPO|nr:hypothetical protein VHEMI06172 [[Torrubiella] hemipterigena]